MRAFGAWVVGRTGDDTTPSGEIQQGCFQGATGPSYAGLPVSVAIGSERNADLLGDSRIGRS